MQKVSDELKLQQIYQMLDKIDDDKDGHLKVDDVLKVEQTYFCNLLAKRIKFNRFMLCSRVTDYRNDWQGRCGPQQ